MKSLPKCFLVLAVLSGLLSPLANAQDESAKKGASETTPTGTWAWVHKNEAGRKTECEMTLKEEKGKVKCSFTVGKIKFESKKGAFKNGVFSVTFSNKDGVAYSFEGKVKGKSLRGKYSTPDSADEKIEWRARKTVGVGEIVGTWNLFFETPDGNTVEPVFQIEADDDGNLTIDFEPQDDSPTITVKETIFKKGILTIVTEVEFQGSELEAEWELKFKNKTTKGTLYYLFKESGQEGEFEIEGEKVD